jgi:purine nucleosidase/pyrimidine-specific ribonucleoside hydrolase
MALPKRVIIDTDPGVDDALALILALRSPEIRVEAITTVSGNVPVDQATKNAIRVLDLLRPEPRPIVGKGASRPLKKSPITAQSVHGADGLGELGRFTNPDGSPLYPEVELPEDLPNAFEVILDLVGRQPGEMTLIALGPLTNVALALQAEPARMRRLRELVIMGGAIRVPGNVTPAAEFNIHADPHAAANVLASGLSITLVPLDVTRQVRLPRQEVRGLAERVDDPVVRFVHHATTKAMVFYEQREGVASMALHDPLAVGVAVDPSLVRAVPLMVDVETEGRLTDGMTVGDLRPISEELKRPPNLQVALEVDAARFLSMFKERVCPGSW